MRKSKVALILLIAVVCAFLAYIFRHHYPKFNSVDSTAALDFVNSRPIPGGSYRVLFIGDSLTIHGRVPQLWDHFSGMAASSPEKDFVHLTIASLQLRLGARPVEAFYDNGGDGKIAPMLAYVRSHPELKPDLVILQGGENDKFNDDFRATYTGLLSSSSHVIVLGDWFDDTKSDFDRAEAAKKGYPFVDLRAIERNRVNSGNAGPYNVPGVAMHPNDAGMKAISDAIIADVP